MRSLVSANVIPYGDEYPVAYNKALLKSTAYYSFEFLDVHQFWLVWSCEEYD